VKEQKETLLAVKDEYPHGRGFSAENLCQADARGSLEEKSAVLMLLLE
jgi:hypothetical protein